MSAGARPSAPHAGRRKRQNDDGKNDAPGDGGTPGLGEDPAEGDRPRGGPDPSGLMISAPVSPGELIDKITILEIKCVRIPDAAKRALAADELRLLIERRDAAVPASEALDSLAADLRGVNESLWSVEDDLRRFEAKGEFGAAFVALARSVYVLNDRRAALKREINALLGARLREVKSHPDHR